MNKKIITLPLLAMLLSGCGSNKLPKPQAQEGILGELFFLDANINTETIDKYLFRADSVYRDMRMLEDPADYAAIGGDSFLSGFVAGFEVVPLPYIIPVVGTLPEAVGEGYAGPTLFVLENDKYVPAYKESLAIIEYLFPKDKNILLMCGGAGYAGMMRGLLIELGWNADTLYNTGGFWAYEGNHRIDVKRTNENGEVVYDFYKVSYHDIDFTTLLAV